MTTQTRIYAVEPQPYGEIISGALVAGGLAVAGWLVRMALGETLRGIREALGNLQRSVDGQSGELRAAKEEIAEHQARLAVVEDRFSRLDG